MSWRKRASPIIAKVLAETKGKPEVEIRQALYAAYPFGPRQYHPYKIWLDEIQRQRGRKGTVKKADIIKLQEWEQLYGKREA